MESTVQKTAVPTVVAQISLATTAMGHVSMAVLVHIKEKCVMQVRLIVEKSQQTTPPY